MGVVVVLVVVKVVVVVGNTGLEHWSKLGDVGRLGTVNGHGVGETGKVGVILGGTDDGDVGLLRGLGDIDFEGDIGGDDNELSKFGRLDVAGFEGDMGDVRNDGEFDDGNTGTDMGDEGIVGVEWDTKIELVDECTHEEEVVGVIVGHVKKFNGPRLK